ncbi:hypothetical protein niasHT_033405 [Heterodera trifolii]|uniref:Uncharacterized protein n=1 Tax=Heterodera trifolii TaxID=157864 RepID=A0ABD2I9J3_9BILA
MDAILADLNSTINRHSIDPQNEHIIQGLRDLVDSFSVEEPTHNVLDFDSDDEDDVYIDSDTGESADDGGNRDPTNGKYPFETQLKIAKMLADGKSYKHVLSTFVESRNRHEAIHDHDMVVIALLKAREVGLDGFKVPSSNLAHKSKKFRLLQIG